jgi:hypothetical protein
MAAAADRCLASSAVDAIDRLIARIGFENLAQSLRHQILSWYTELGALDKAYVVANDMLDHLGRHGIVGMTWSGLWLREMRAFRRDRRFEPFAARPGSHRFGIASGRQTSSIQTPAESATAAGALAIDYRGFRNLKTVWSVRPRSPGVKTILV